MWEIVMEKRAEGKRAEERRGEQRAVTAVMCE
jgi:hypothetical protein